MLTYTNLDPQPTLTRYEVSIAAKSLLKGLMGKDPSTRISSIKALQASHWLANQDWDALRVGDRATTPPFVPINALTTPGFDEEFLDPTAENFDQAFTRYSASAAHSIQDTA